MPTCVPPAAMPQAARCIPASRAACVMRGFVVTHLQRYFGCALGKGARAAKTEIEKNKFKDKTCREALPLLAKTCVL